MKKTQNVVMKGTRDGLTLHLDDQCSFLELKKELTEKLTENTQVHDDQPALLVKVRMGNRYLTDEQKEEIRQLILQKKNIFVESIDSNVITKDEAVRMKEETEIVSVATIVRSGQVLQVPGNLLLIGDVNPGGTVVAGGNIFIIGTLKGIAHAGAFGNTEAIISASVMVPTQLRIHDCINGAPNDHGDVENRLMECAYIDHQGQIAIDKLHVLKQLRPNLTKLKGGF